MKISFERQAGSENAVKTYEARLDSGLTAKIDYKITESVDGNPQEAVIFLAGLQMSPDSETVRPLSESYAESSNRNTYTIQSQLLTESNDAATDDLDLFYEEARAIGEFIKDRGLKDVIIAGYSVGGMRGIDLANVLKNDPEVKVRGLILLSSPGLYEQEEGALKSNLIKDSLFTPQEVVRRQGEYGKAFGRGLAGAMSLANVLFKGNKVKREFDEMEQYNNRVENIDVPVVVIVGAQDQVVEADKIVPPEIDPRDREEYLKQNIFKESPYVKMVVADKLGKHGLPVFRAESVAAASIGLLGRYERGRTDKNSIEPVSTDNPYIV
jgi:pimeloyl-ACP methyl ester carboxylesterase